MLTLVLTRKYTKRNERGSCCYLEFCCSIDGSILLDSINGTEGYTSKSSFNFSALLVDF